MAWEVVIGLETHVQLQTRSKIFSPASTDFGAAPNTQAHMVDLALPGVLPVMNRAAVEAAIRFGLSVGATIAPDRFLRARIISTLTCPRVIRSASSRSPWSRVVMSTLSCPMVAAGRLN